MPRTAAGDTLIEVLLAVTIFSMVSVLSVTAMNRSSATAERALETTLVKQQIDSQAEELRAAQHAATNATDTTGSPWNEIKAVAETGTIDIDNECPNPPGESFYIIPSNSSAPNRGHRTLVNGANFKNMKDELAIPFAKIDGSRSYGIWIEKDNIPADARFKAAYEFTVRACWYSVGTNMPMQLDTSVRLYDPL